MAKMPKEISEEADAHVQEIAALRIDLDAALAEVGRLRAALRIVYAAWENGAPTLDGLTVPQVTAMVEGGIHGWSR